MRTTQHAHFALVFVLALAAVPAVSAGQEMLQSLRQAAGVTGSSASWEVTFLEAPLGTADGGDIYGKLFDAYHAGLGFRNEETKEEFMVEFNAKDGFNLEKFFPSFTTDGHLVYKKAGEIRDHPYVDPELHNTGKPYWTKYLPIAKITDSQFSRFREWVTKAQRSPPEYQIFGLRVGDEEVVKSHTCYDFVFSCIDALDKLGVKFTVTEKERDVLDLLVEEGTLENNSSAAEESAFWAYVFNVVEHAKLVTSDLKHGLALIVRHINEARKLQEGHPRLYYTINGDVKSFKLTDQYLVAGYRTVPIPPSRAAVEAGSNTAVYGVRHE